MGQGWHRKFSAFGVHPKPSTFVCSVVQKVSQFEAVYEGVVWSV